MFDALFQSGWGAYAMMLFMLIPFLCIFFYVVIRKSIIDPSPSTADKKSFKKFEYLWMGLVVFVFVTVNVASIQFMPTVITANAAASDENIFDVDVSAVSWSYDISEQTLEVGRPIRFSAKSEDTMHSFAVYHPDGRMLFTMMLMPKMDGPTSLIYTFKDPGTYTVRCLEYCGLSHHDMRDELTLVASN
ncbi:MAG: hypothetical protein CMF70_11330 [Magnetovibrio sp.]|nr:hypothetical protein [Magnetovibrio sp.]